MKRFLITLEFVIILILAGALIWFKTTHKPPVEPVVTAQSIVQQLNNEGFLVTQGIFVQERVQIEKKSGNAFKDFFLGQTVEASALLHIDAGIDLTKLDEADVEVTDDSIMIELPDVEIRSVSLSGPISLDNKQGIIKRLVDNDDGYNEAIVLLKEKGSEVLSNEDIRMQIEEGSEAQVSRMLQLLTDDKVIEIKK